MDSIHVEKGSPFLHLPKSDELECVQAIYLTSESPCRQGTLNLVKSTNLLLKNEEGGVSNIPIPTHTYAMHKPSTIVDWYAVFE